MIHPEVRLFLDHLKIDLGLSENTKSAYSSDLKQFISHLEQHSVTVQNATESDLQLFLKSLSDSAPKATTLGRKISTLKHFYGFLYREQKIQDDPSALIESPKLPRSIPKALDPAHLEQLLNSTTPGLPYPGPLAEALQFRDRTLVYLLYACGMRITEILSLKLHQVDIEGGFVRTVGKRNKERIIPFPALISDLLHDYKSLHREKLFPKSNDFFIGARGMPLTRQAFWKTLKKIALLAGIPHSLHPHVLRHTFATDLLKAGMNLRSLQSLLGHADLQTTQIYTQVAPDTLKEVIDRYHPRGSQVKQTKNNGS